MTGLMNPPTLVVDEIEEFLAGDNYGIVHTVCWCNDDIALCGKNVEDMEWSSEEDEEHEIECFTCESKLKHGYFCLMCLTWFDPL